MFNLQPIGMAYGHLLFTCSSRSAPLSQKKNILAAFYAGTNANDKRPKWAFEKFFVPSNGAVLDQPVN